MPVRQTNLLDFEQKYPHILYLLVSQTKLLSC